jgi:hypothetical protein
LRIFCSFTSATGADVSLAFFAMMYTSLLQLGRL